MGSLFLCNASGSRGSAGTEAVAPSPSLLQSPSLFPPLLSPVPSPFSSPFNPSPTLPSLHLLASLSFSLPSPHATPARSTKAAASLDQKPSPTESLGNTHPLTPGCTLCAMPGCCGRKRGRLQGCTCVVAERESSFRTAKGLQFGRRGFCGNDIGPGHREWRGECTSMSESADGV